MVNNGNRMGLYPLVICYIAIEHGPKFVDLPNLKMVISHSFLYVYQRVFFLKKVNSPRVPSGDFRDFSQLLTGSIQDGAPPVMFVGL